MTSCQHAYDEDSDCIACGQSAFTQDRADRLPPQAGRTEPGDPPRRAEAAPAPPVAGAATRDPGQHPSRLPGPAPAPAAGSPARPAQPGQATSSPPSLPGPLAAGTTCRVPGGGVPHSAAAGDLHGDRDPAGSARRGEPAGLAVPPGRSWTVKLPPGLKLLSLNDRLHWRERNRRAQALKKAAWAMAVQARIPPLERISVTVEYQPPDRRHRDADNACAASGKPCIDGLVAARVVPDDESPRYVTGVAYRIGPVFPLGRLVLHLAEVTDGTEAGAA